MIPNTKSPYSLKELLTALIHQNVISENYFEHQFSAFFGFPFGLFFNYGRSGLYTLLTVLGFKDQEVLIPAYTCPVVANAVILSKNKVKFMDNEPDHFNVSPSGLSSSLNSATRMIIPTPLLGYSLDTKGYKEVISKKAPEAFILYDDAQGFCINDQRDILSKYADGAMFGLGEGKVVSSIYGGMLLLRDKSLYKEIKAFRDKEFRKPNSTTSARRLLYGLGYWMAYRNPVLYLFEYLKNKTRILDSFKNDISTISFPEDADERPTALQVQLGQIQMKLLGEIIEERRRITGLYEKKFHETGLPFFPRENEFATPHFPYLTKDRDSAIHILWKKGVIAGYPFSQACPDIPVYGSDREKYPNATIIAKSIITLPVWPGMTDSQINHVIDAIIFCRETNPSVFIT